MGLEIPHRLVDLKDNDPELADVFPRNHCRQYVLENGCQASLVLKESFDDLCRANQFKKGPFQDTFGDGDHEPYNPYRQVFGTLREGTVVYYEMHKEKQNLARTILESS